MAPRRKPLPDDDTPEPSRIYLDGYMRLGAAVVAQAFSDLRDTRRPEKAVESFIWLVYGDGLAICNAVGFEIDSDDLVKAIGGIHAKKIFRASQFANDDTRSDTES